MFLASCSCIDHLLDSRKEGDCQDYHMQQRWCYVHQPSNCKDVVNSNFHDGLQWSIEACKRKQS